MRQQSDSAGERDYDGGRVVKESCEHAGEFGLEHHGSVHKRAYFEARGALRRGNETPKPVPWSRNKKRP